jgi:hypothetical protein|uniref:Uncharacterized protein n=1 Tax=Eutreptiella gymnastica TaxID=73025 RepID=A0A7S4LIK6_9EUGL|mmetsp:Transcript_79044/g.131974  ORF Transcript_79044/g.131974 Transcript_79044/m.131974 type:complete len:129 (+) Transcript_79044:909-1295(+)
MARIGIAAANIAAAFLSTSTTLPTGESTIAKQTPFNPRPSTPGPVFVFVCSSKGLHVLGGDGQGVCVCGPKREQYLTLAVLHAILLHATSFYFALRCILCALHCVVLCHVLCCTAEMHLNSCKYSTTV